MASGMGAITVVGHLLNCGARIVAPHDCYGGTWRLLDAWARKGRFKVAFADLTDNVVADLLRWCTERYGDTLFVVLRAARYLDAREEHLSRVLRFAPLERCVYTSSRSCPSYGGY